MVDVIRHPFLVLAFVSLSACQTPPDVAPFAQATAALDLTVNATARAAFNEIAAVDRGVADEFNASWERRLKAMSAMSDYSSSLVALVAAADDSARAAQAVLDSAERLFTTVEAAYPGGGEVGKAISSGAVVAFRTYAQDRAARTVSKSLAKADPAIQIVANALADDFAIMHRSLATLRSRAITEYVASQKLDVALIGQVYGLKDELEKLNKGLLAAPDDPRLLEQALALAALLERERALPDYTVYVTGLEAIERRYAAYDATARTAAETARAWGKSHRELIQAAELRRASGFQNLVALSQELLDLYKQARKIP